MERVALPLVDVRKWPFGTFLLSAVRLVDGQGMVGRADAALWWTTNAALIPALSRLSGGGFQDLANAILDLDFDIGGVVAIDMTSGVGFVSGAATLVSGDVVWDGSTTGTWIEQRLIDPANFAANATLDAVDEQTDLIAGVVRGGGFVYGQPALPHVGPAPVDEQAPEPASEVEPVALVPDLAAQASTETEEGSDTVVADREVDASETLIIPSMPPSVVTEPEPAAQQPRQPIVAKVDFDDGREVEVRGGVIVGRNPEGGDVAIGFVAITVLGEFVSRRHWQLDLRNRTAELRDLGSASGTIVEADGATTRLGPNETIELGARSRVLFADHWATITVRPA